MSISKIVSKPPLSWNSLWSLTLPLKFLSFWNISPLFQKITLFQNKPFSLFKRNILPLSPLFKWNILSIFQKKLFFKPPKYISIASFLEVLKFFYLFSKLKLIFSNSTQTQTHIFKLKLKFSNTNSYFQTSKKLFLSKKFPWGFEKLFISF